MPELIETFEALGDWHSQCEYLMELGRAITKLPAYERIDANRVRGCQSNVWLIANVKPGNPPVIEIKADSDAQIVRGLIAVLLIAYSGKTPQEILQIDIEQTFAKLGLTRHLVPFRRNGLLAMVQRIRLLAAHSVAN